MTNFIQPIDAGIGRSVRTAIGHQLDDWLMHEEHMEIWEGKMSAGERRILMTEFVSSAMNKVMGTDYEESRISAFERTGCLLTWLVNEEHDNRIRPQGMQVGKFLVPRNRSNEGTAAIENEALPTPIDEEEAAALDEAQLVHELIEEHNNDIEFE
jgi:hypothetical protein